MAQTIILFLSEARPSAAEQIYVCPDGLEVCGAQTNEAPVKYLLRAYPNVSRLLCIVTAEAEKTTWPAFQAMVSREKPGVVLKTVAFREDQEFSEGPLGEIVSAVEKSDEILLETTGGFRNAVMDLLLLSRVLSYKGISTVDAVYSNFKTKRVESVAHLIGLFDLVGGMQELTSFGSVHTLRRYYAGQPKDETINALLTAMDQMTETITLCRTRLIDRRMEEFDCALRNAEHCADPLMQTLLPVFRAKFGKKLTTPGLIKWCVESDMIQQAQTIYKERIPAYILRSNSDILTVKPDAPEPDRLKDYVDMAEARFYEQFLKMGRNMRRAYYGFDPDAADGAEKDYTVTTLEHLEELFPHSYFIPQRPVAQVRVIAMDYLYIRALRNMINHANEKTTPSQKQISEYLCSCGYKPLEDVTAADIKETLLSSLEHLRAQPRKEKSR